MSACDTPRNERVTVRDALPLLVIHLACLGIFFVGVSRAALIALGVTYVVRVFALTAGYHRYFSHKSYRTSRFFQFVLGFTGTAAAQLGPLWWASHHRMHHRHSDTEDDVHSPARRGFWWAHVGWLLCRRYAHTETAAIKDFARFPELRFLDRHPYLPPLLLALALFGFGAWAESARPGWGTAGWQMVVWGFFVSTTLVYHVTFAVNSVTHVFGYRRYDTGDTSRNSFLVALLTMGEGWHNNHHHYAVCARQGFRWWEIDVSYYLLRVLSLLRIVWDVREPPKELRSNST